MKRKNSHKILLQSYEKSPKIVARTNPSLSPSLSCRSPVPSFGGGEGGGGYAMRSPNLSTIGKTFAPLPIPDLRGHPCGTLLGRAAPLPTQMAA